MGLNPAFFSRGDTVFKDWDNARKHTSTTVLSVVRVALHAPANRPLLDQIRLVSRR